MRGLHAALLICEHKKEALREQTVSQIPSTTRNSAGSRPDRLTDSSGAPRSIYSSGLIRDTVANLPLGSKHSRDIQLRPLFTEDKSKSIGVLQTQRSDLRQSSPKAKIC